MLRIFFCVTLFVTANLIHEAESFEDHVLFQDDVSVADEIKSNKAKIESLQSILAVVSRQLMLQQLFMEERIRSEGHSGLKQVRVNRIGSRPYHADSHAGASIASIHDHANNMRTIGMGEFIAVINGVEFRTRHNDYRLFMPHRTSKDYHKYEPIPFPPVPPEVKAKKTPSDQIVEMREWFKAWKDQDYSKRDYRKYFKPVLCYLEGAWTHGDTKGDIDEPFPSDRHFVDAKNWFDLQEKIRFTSYSGRKSNFENYAFLPTTIMNITNGTTPEFAQWNYRIMCHPVRRDVPTNRFRTVDDFGVRMRSRLTMEDLRWTRQARFQLNPKDRDVWNRYEFPHKYEFLDKLMEEIPGKDNYQGSLQDEVFDSPAMEMEGNKQLNSAYYNRMYKVTAKGAMGLSTRQRGFSDENLFMAMTSSPKVAGMNVKDCKRVGKREECKYYMQKWSYAIPLEIIYLTPLVNWNPYNIEYKGGPRSPTGKTVVQGGRNGATAEKALNGTHETLYYMTPAAFFNGDSNGKDPADTTKSVVWVLDKNGTPRKMSASGVRIFMPSIPGVGMLRQRYPIMPVHAEGSSAWKEASALTDALMESQKYLGLYKESINTKPIPTLPPPRKLTLQLRRATITRDPPGPHIHEFSLEPYQVADLHKGVQILVTTSEAAGHQHSVLVVFQRERRYYYISTCDGKYTPWPYRCWDKHHAMLDIVTSKA